MILQSLVRCYDSLAAQGTLKRPGWSYVKVQWGLRLKENGELVSVELLGKADVKGKPTPVQKPLPTPVKRTSGKAACFLCDNAKYLFGITNEPYDGTGKNPANSVRIRLQKAGATVYAAKENGVMTLYSDGQKITVQP